MPAPRVIIKAQSRNGKTITVYGQVTGLGEGGTVTAALPAATVPNGAVSKPAVAVTLNPAGEFEHAFTALAYGTYAPAVVTATNADGTNTATTMQMVLFANGTAPVGTPAVLFPEWKAPAFTAAEVAQGAEVTTVTLESTSTSNQTNVPFTFGQPFPSGALAPGDYLVGKAAGIADIPLQFNVKATHPNGSVRHAVISGVLPSLPAGTKKTISMVRAASGTSTVPLASSAITSAGFSASVRLTIDSVLYTADATPMLAAGLTADRAWLGGSISTEYTVNIPFRAADGTAHPDLTAQFNARYYQGANAAKIDVVVEHVKAYTAVNTVNYTGEVRIGGVVALNISTALAHYPAARWKRTFWWGHTNPAHIKHNVPYLLDSCQVPNFDRTTVVPESVLAQYATDIAKPEFALMGRGLYAAAFAGQGGRPELGLTSAWYAAAIVSQDKRAKALMLALAECAGSFSVHRRDDSAGPAAGQPMDVIHFPTSTSLGTAGDSKNYATGGYEKLPATAASPYGPDVSHQSSFAYLPYVVTGDLYHLEELHYWGNWNVVIQNCGYRSYEKGLMQSEQVRGQAWSLRTLGQAAAITPDNHPAKPRFNFLLGTNLTWYNKTYTDNLNANKLGIISHGIAIIYHNNDADKRGIGNFQDDFFAQSLGHLAELGHVQSARFLRWKAKWQVSRLIGQGICWTDAVMYSPTVRTPAPESKIYDTIAEVVAATAAYGRYTTPEIQAKLCDSQERVDAINARRSPGEAVRLIGDLGGYATSTEGFAANLQPALAYAADVGYPDAKAAWDRFQSRTIKPDYGYGPQFSVVPRGFVAPVEPDLPPEPSPGPTEPAPLPLVQSTDIELRRSGASNLGGPKQSAAAGLNYFPAVNAAESEKGKTEYRCLYLHNAHPTKTLKGPAVWLNVTTPSSAVHIEIGVGTAPVNGTEQTVATETTPPAGVVFKAATGIVLGDIPPGQGRSFWLRRSVAAGAPKLTPFKFTIRTEGKL